MTCTADLDDYLVWQGVLQVVQRECERIQLKTGEVTRATTSALISASADEASPAALAALWQGHWTIENRRHYVPDATFGRMPPKCTWRQRRKPWPPCATV